MGAPAIAAIQQRRIGDGAPMPRDLRGARHIGEDLSGLDLSHCDLTGADLSRCDLSGSRLAGAKLRDAILHGANLDGAELLGADLTDADLSECSAVQAGFGHASMVRTRLFEAQLVQATLTDADMTGADLRAANLQGARLRNATLDACDVRSATLVEADLSESSLNGAMLDGSNLQRARMAHIRGYTEASWIGVDLREVDFCGAHLLRRHVLDENYLHEFRHQSPTNEWCYKLWWITSDCGRSFKRWGLWTLLIAVIFAAIYTQVSVDYGSHETWLSPLYYSVVTLTTLGYGDVLPTSVTAQAVSMIEVIIGYVMLGGALSIFTTKMARRAS